MEGGDASFPKTAGHTYSAKLSFTRWQEPGVRTDTVGI